LPWHRSKPREDRSGYQDETTDLREGCPEANVMHGGFKLFHILIERKGFAVLQAAQSFKEVYLDA